MAPHDRSNAAPDPEPVMIYIDWSDLRRVPTQHVNQFVTQVGTPTSDGTPDGIYLALGHLAPPVIISSDGEMRQREIEAAKAGAAPEILGRFHMSRERAEEFLKVLQETLGKYDDAAELFKARVSERGQP